MKLWSEPELSLNLNWQRELLALLLELVPETQIIVASHSPAIPKRIPHYLIELNRGEFEGEKYRLAPKGRRIFWQILNL